MILMTPATKNKPQPEFPWIKAVRRSHILSLLLVIVFAGVSFIGVLSAGWKLVLGVQLQGGVEVVLRPADEGNR